MGTGTAQEWPAIDNQHTPAKSPQIGRTKASGGAAAQINGVKFAVVVWVYVENRRATAGFQRPGHKVLPLCDSKVVSPNIHCSSHLVLLLE